MRLSFLGATRTTTGSKYVLEANGERVLLECGMFQGRRSESIEKNTNLPFDASTIHATLLSHAHIDHSGLLPVLCKSGFTGKIYCTSATADLCKIMLLDSAHIQEQDAAFISKKNIKKGRPSVNPLYTQADAQNALEQFNPVSYNTPIKICDWLTATWIDAGHIIGSASIVLDITEDGRTVRLGFSGDIGRGNNDMLKNPNHPTDLDYLMIESTYGNREHEKILDVKNQICRMINHAVNSRGKIIIPSFAVGRTQQLLFTLYQLHQSNCIPTIPIFVDSPLSTKATAIFRKHPECYNKAFYKLMMSGNKPFSSAHVQFTSSVEESIAINDLKIPCIIISASGMAEAGRVRHHIKNNIEDERNTILIVGWCAPHTLGSRLASGHKEVNIFGDPYRVHARIETINVFSGHADKTELRTWAENVTGSIRKVFVIHGEEQAGLTFANTLRLIYPSATVTVPEYATSVEL